MNALRGVLSVSTAFAVATLIGVWLSAESDAQTTPQESKPSIAGAWTLNRSLSDQSSGARGDQNGEERGRRGDGGRRGGFGRGGGGRGGRGGYGRSGDSGSVSPDAAARMRDALRDVMDPPDHLVITETESMIVLTSGEGRTTRLAPDGRSVKDDNTKVERKTRWDGGKLVSEISGLGSGKLTQTFAINPELHQLRITVQAEARGQTPARTSSHVYDADPGR